jgi:hypothetical protein
MPPNVAEKTSHGQDAWWDALRLIAGLDATPTQKYLLTLVHRHTNRKTRRAWASQKTVAWEMSVDDSTVERIFRWGKQKGIIRVERVRKGKNPADQHNFYWLDTERMKVLQRKPEQPSSVRVDTPPKQPAPMRVNSREHPAPMPPNTPHQCGRTTRTHAGIGFEVAGNEDSGDEKARALHSARKTAAPQSGLATQPENRPRVSFENNFSARELNIIEDAQQYIESQVKHGHRIPKLTVIQYVKENGGAFNHERSIEMALKAISKFPEFYFP